MRVPPSSRLPLSSFGNLLRGCWTTCFTFRGHGCAGFHVQSSSACKKFITPNIILFCLFTSHLATVAAKSVVDGCGPLTYTREHGGRPSLTATLKCTLSHGTLRMVQIYSILRIVGPLRKVERTGWLLVRNMNFSKSAMIKRVRHCTRA